METKMPQQKLLLQRRQIETLTGFFNQFWTVAFLMCQPLDGAAQVFALGKYRVRSHALF